MESICAQIPMVGIPFFGDHFGNLKRMEAKDAALILLKSEISDPESIYRAMQTVLSSSK